MAEDKFDTYVLSPESVQEPPATVWLALRKIGPGLILAGSIVGTGELIQTTQAGAKAGFVLLWLVILSCVIKVFVQIELGRYAVSSGDTSLRAFHRLPGPGVAFVWWWLVMMLVTQLQMGAMVGGVGRAFHMAMPGVSPWLAEMMGAVSSPAGDYLAKHPEMSWAVVAAASTSALLASGSYRIVEWGTTILVVMFTFTTVVCVGILPATDHPIHAADLASGFSFQLPTEVIVVAIAMFGITGVGASELIAYPYWCIEKGYARNVGLRDDSAEWVARARGWMRVMFADAWVSMVVYTLATVAFFLLGAAVLHKSTDGTGLPGDVEGMMRVLSHMYVPVMGERVATWFIVIGAFAVLYSTLFAATAGNCRTFTDFLHINQFIRLNSHASRLRWVRGLCVVFPMLDFALYVWIGNPPLMVTIGGAIQAITLPMIASAAVYLRYRRTDSRITSGKIWDALLWLSMIGMYLAAAALLYGIWLKWTAK